MEAVEVFSPVYPEAERYGGINGANDLGDIKGIPYWAIQVKNVAVAQLGKFVADAETQRIRAGALWSAVMLKLKGKHMRNGVFVMSNEQALRIMKRLEECENGTCRSKD
ncbi:hypothetical protein [Kitasatospora sp. MBT66]|uniref:hypothetical protein n=1 Tax=Kitasatospora sp. MBT66 TaxID=1444769 RepID=UPI0011EA667A|nr:hypothetical protein [Kitasatospora sp. MBT66]